MEQRWIPVAERLPEESGSYLTWVRYDNEEFMSIEEIDCEGILKEWNFTGDVLYWMPLPEPYQVGAKNAHTKKSQTNADRIRGMTDEELLDFLCSIETYDCGSIMTIEGGITMCSVTEVEEWLLRKVEV